MIEPVSNDAINARGKNKIHLSQDGGGIPSKKAMTTPFFRFLIYILLMQE
jgi:hypothetical protein